MGYIYALSLYVVYTVYAIYMSYVAQTPPPLVFPPVVAFMEVYNKSQCQPREVLVEVLHEYPEEVEYIYIPSCVVLRRCAGCCSDEKMQCTPTSSHNITMEVSGGLWAHLSTLGGEEDLLGRRRESFETAGPLFVCFGWCFCLNCSAANVLIYFVTV